MQVKHDHDSALSLVSLVDTDGDVPIGGAEEWSCGSLCGGRHLHGRRCDCEADEDSHEIASWMTCHCDRDAVAAEPAKAGFGSPPPHTVTAIKPSFAGPVTVTPSAAVLGVFACPHAAHDSEDATGSAESRLAHMAEVVKPASAGEALAVPTCFTAVATAGVACEAAALPPPLPTFSLAPRSADTTPSARSEDRDSGLPCAAMRCETSTRSPVATTLPSPVSDADPGKHTDPLAGLTSCPPANVGASTRPVPNKSLAWWPFGGAALSASWRPRPSPKPTGQAPDTPPLAFTNTCRAMAPQAHAQTAKADQTGHASPRWLGDGLNSLTGFMQSWMADSCSVLSPCDLGLRVDGRGQATAAAATQSLAKSVPHPTRARERRGCGAPSGVATAIKAVSAVSKVVDVVTGGRSACPSAAASPATDSLDVSPYGCTLSLCPETECTTDPDRRADDRAWLVIAEPGDGGPVVHLLDCPDTTVSSTTASRTSKHPPKAHKQRSPLRRHNALTLPSSHLLDHLDTSLRSAGKANEDNGGRGGTGTAARLKEKRAPAMMTFPALSLSSPLGTTHSSSTASLGSVQRNAFTSVTDRPCALSIASTPKTSKGAGFGDVALRSRLVEQLYALFRQPPSLDLGGAARCTALFHALQTYDTQRSGLLAHGAGALSVSRDTLISLLKPEEVVTHGSFFPRHKTRLTQDELNHFIEAVSMLAEQDGIDAWDYPAAPPQLPSVDPAVGPSSRRATTHTAKKRASTTAPTAAASDALGGSTLPMAATLPAVRSSVASTVGPFGHSASSTAPPNSKVGVPSAARQSSKPGTSSKKKNGRAPSTASRGSSVDAKTTKKKAPAAPAKKSTAKPAAAAKPKPARAASTSSAATSKKKLSKAGSRASSVSAKSGKAAAGGGAAAKKKAAKPAAKPKGKTSRAGSSVAFSKKGAVTVRKGATMKKARTGSRASTTRSSIKPGSSRGGSAGKRRRTTKVSIMGLVDAVVEQEADARRTVVMEEEMERDSLQPLYNVLVMEVVRTQVQQLNSRQRQFTEAVELLKERGLRHSNIDGADDAEELIELLKERLEGGATRELQQLRAENASMRERLDDRSFELDKKSSEMELLRTQLARQMTRREVERDALRAEVQSALQSTTLDVERLKKDLGHRIDIACSTFRTPKYDTAMRAMQELVAEVQREVQEHHDTLSKLIVSIGAKDTFAKEEGDSMHSNFPAKYRASLRALEKDSILNILDVLSFQEGVVPTVGKALYVLEETSHKTNVM